MLTKQDIGKTCNHCGTVIKKGTVRKMRATGISGRPRLRNDKEILRLRKSGLSYRLISQTLKCSIGMIQRACKPQQPLTLPNDV